jgi:type I restriction enzyme S subunit
MNKHKNENKLVPKLRFPEFKNDGDWEEKLLKDACQMQAGKFINASEIKENKSDDLFPCYGGNGLRGYTKSYTHIGKYSLIGRQGALCGNITLAKEKFHATEHAVVATPKEEVDTDWLYYKLILLNLNQYATGQAQPGLSVDNLARVKIHISKNIKEQQKIATCLSSLDEVITAERQKLDILQAHKRGLLQNLLPQEGETVPKFRFKEFEESGEWEEKELGSFCNSLSSGKDKNVEDGEYELYGSTGIIGRAENASYEGDFILVARVGANAGLLNKVTGKFGVTDNTLVIDLVKKDIIDFIYYSLENVGLKELVFGSGQPLITGGQLKSFLLLIPISKDEQQKIAACLSSLDDLINAQTQKLEALQLHKKGLLQGLFPNLNEVTA